VGQPAPRRGNDSVEIATEPAYLLDEVIAMRRSFFLSLGLVVGLGAVALAIPLCEYQSPLTDLSSLVLSFAYQYHNDPYGLENYDTNDGLFGTEYVRLYDTPEFGFDVSIQNDMLISAIDISSFTIVADGNFKRYFLTEADSFAFAGASVRSSSEFETVGLSFNVGLGYGRFTDVTPLAKAVRIDEFLVRRGSLTGHLHPVDQQIIAREIGSAASYPSIAELLAVVLEIIEGSGLVKTGGLDALDISEVTGFIQERGLSRYCGWDVKFGLGYALLDPSGDGSDLRMTGAFNYAFTTTPEVQFLAVGSFSGPTDLLDTNRIDLTLEYDFLIADFLNLNAAYDFSRETWAGEPTDIHKLSFDLLLTPVDTADVVLGISLEHRPYYLEWSIDVQLSIQMDLL
jgi:hypothetical protein